MFGLNVFHLNGVRFDAFNPPWWVTSVLGWIAMYKRIQESCWEDADGYRNLLDMKLRSEPPGFLYEFFRNFIQFEEASRR